MWITVLPALIGLMQQPAGVDSAGASKPTLSVEPQVQAQPGKHFVVKLDTNCVWVRWTVPPGLERVPTKDTAYGDKAFVGYGPAGVYEFRIEGTKSDIYAETKCVVFVGQPGPPGPPDPRPPGPLPPKPTDPLFDALVKAYAADPSPQKRDQLGTLISVYRTASDAALNDTSIASSGDLFEKLRTVSKLMLGDAALRPLREVLAVENAKTFSADAPLDAELRAKARAHFARLAGLLEAMK
jgi:hypothetical protein